MPCTRGGAGQRKLRARDSGDFCSLLFGVRQALANCLFRVEIHEDFPAIDRVARND